MCPSRDVRDRRGVVDTVTLTGAMIGIVVRGSLIQANHCILLWYGRVSRCAQVFTPRGVSSPHLRLQATEYCKVFAPIYHIAGKTEAEILGGKLEVAEPLSPKLNLTRIVVNLL